jgi:D-alanyl-lipoteichoic acid acyltransferase DltB (MBOAT superfamily)
MLFSNPDYAVFLIAVFFLYALSRFGGRAGMLARIAIMVLLGDLVFLLVAKDLDAVWDPLGGVLYRVLASGGHSKLTWPIWMFERWVIGSCVLAAAVLFGIKHAGWIASTRGQQLIARGIVVVLAAVAATVAIASAVHELDATTAAIADQGHLAVLSVLGIAIGAAQRDATRPLGRVLVLFVASSLFYHAWAAEMPGPYRYLLGVLLGTIVLDYYLAIWIENTQDRWRRKALVIVSLCSNLGILCFFKYTDFLTQDVMHLPVRPLHLILPAGISFHTFQSLSYTIDVYRKQLKATRSVVEFATFVLFFPQLVAGPIVRAQDLLPQLSDLPALEVRKATDGLFRISIGLFKKIAIADRVGEVLVDRVFKDPQHFTSVEVLAGVIGYALQIYCDFSGYSDIAIGSAQVLGFDLPENFRTPYRSANIQEFWRRWHISLSTWLRDYLYVTLGGNRGAPWRTYVNLSLTMLLGGLWHGPRWTFVVWGGMHGFGLAITRFFQRHRGKTRTAVTSIFVWCAAVAAAGVAIEVMVIPSRVGTWPRLVFAWLVLTPLWAVVTAWLGGDSKHEMSPRVETPPFAIAVRRPAEWLRIAMCVSGACVFAALRYESSDWWLACVVLTWLLALAADLVERDGLPAFGWLARRALATVLVFAYVCVAWVFFRAQSFGGALAVFRALAEGSRGHANVGPIVQIVLLVGLIAHFFPDGSFRWLHDRFVRLPMWGQGLVLGGVALALRELHQPTIVPFIYFQF